MTIRLSNQQIAEFLHRSYATVDGLWFMKVEEKYGFDEALEVDDAVWKVLPKIQARMLKAVAGQGVGIDALYECLTTRLTLEGYAFRAEKVEGNRSFRIMIDKCPWHELMVKSGRGSLAEKVGARICNSEYSVWAAEFGDDISSELQGLICQGARSCVLQFSQAGRP